MTAKLRFLPNSCSQALDARESNCSVDKKMKQRKLIGQKADSGKRLAALRRRTAASHQGVFLSARRCSHKTQLKVSCVSRYPRFPPSAPPPWTGAPTRVTIPSWAPQSSAPARERTI